MAKGPIAVPLARAAVDPLEVRFLDEGEDAAIKLQQYLDFDATANTAQLRCNTEPSLAAKVQERFMACKQGMWRALPEEEKAWWRASAKAPGGGGGGADDVTPPGTCTSSSATAPNSAQVRPHIAVSNSIEEAQRQAQRAAAGEVEKSDNDLSTFLGGGGGGGKKDADDTDDVITQLQDVLKLHFPLAAIPAPVRVAGAACFVHVGDTRQQITVTAEAIASGRISIPMPCDMVLAVANIFVTCKRNTKIAPSPGLAFQLLVQSVAYAQWHDASGAYCTRLNFILNDTDEAANQFALMLYSGELNQDPVD